jgi:hypothetical protein
MRQAIKQIFALIICLNVISTVAMPVFAQKKPGTAAAKAPAAKKGCSGGWSGSVSYTRALYDEYHSDEPLMGRLDKERNRIKHDQVRQVKYEGKALVDGTNPTEAVVSTRATFKDDDKQRFHQKEFDTCHAFNDEHFFITEGRTDTLTEGTVQGPARSFNLYVNEALGTYNFSLKFPKGTGKYSREHHTKRSGFCQAKNNLPIDQSESRDVPIDEESFSVDDRKVDPKNPDILEGTQIIDRNERNNPNAIKVPIYIIRWKFRRCPPPLVVTDIKFYEPAYPSPNTWSEIWEDRNTIDGNQVKIVATVANLSNSVKTGTVQFKELKENTVLPEGSKPETFQPLEEKQVELIWDTSGYAWKDSPGGGQPEIDREIEVSVPNDKMMSDIQVHPKPVIIVGGLWSKKEEFKKFMDFFKAVPNTEWDIHPSGVHPTKIAVDNAPSIDKRVREIQKEQNAWHVDMAAHSTGGLAARVYVDGLMPTQFDGRPTVSHLVMIGTPNMGTPCVTGMNGIITRFFHRNADAISELTIGNMKKFNTMVNKRNGTKFTIIAGLSYNQTCQSKMPGDGIVANGSAVWNIPDRVFTSKPYWHEKMLGDVDNFKETYKRFAVGPKGDHAPDNGDTRGQVGGGSLASLDSEELLFNLRKYGAGGSAAVSTPAGPGADDENEPAFVTGLIVKPGQSTELAVPVTTGTRIALNFMAPANVSLTLLDETGAVVGNNLAGAPGADGVFRTISVDSAVKAGTWKLKIESAEEQDAEVAVAVFIDALTAVS